MPESYLTVRGYGEGEYEEKKSRFIGAVKPVRDEAEAEAFRAEVKAKHPGASHHVYAYILLDGIHKRCSDDGEPHGTAGRPMLQILLHCGIGELCVVVTRWFGGVKLGTGGLVRAYQDSVRAVLAELPQEERVPRCRALVRVEFAHLDRLHRLLPDVEARLLEESYDAAASLTISLPRARWEEFSALLAGRTDGRATCDLLEDTPS